ncbi:microcephalin isoform X2 [Motacilla alba alba]|uniref:microcephalin isoform X2 n=1 Tax=Motacilla alba alba TaxID=1094192 RepID=UPI0018D4F33A|nr:microcephalin isoform X2 [Motacilla alba alba]
MEPALKGVSAFVDVWSSNRTENYSKTFEQQLLDMGAKVSKTLNKHVTHVVFKDGRLTTWKKAQNMGVKIVSVLWVEKCRETGVHVNESLFPAVDTNEGFLLPIKKHKCMQPKDYVEKTPENNRKLQRRLNQMAKELALQKTAVNSDTDVPVLLFEDNGSLIYSPVNKIKDQCNEMERRIKDMEEKRENLSPTGSQVTQTLPSSSSGDCPLSTCVLTNSEDELLPAEQMEECLNSSSDYLCRIETLKRQRTEVAEHGCDTCSDIHVSMSTSVNSPSHGNEEKRLTPKHRARSLTQKQIIQPTLGERLSLGKNHLKFPKKNQNKSKTTVVADESSLLEGFGHITPSEKIVQLNTVPALIDSLSNLPMNNEDLNAYSLDKSFPVDRNYSLLEDKKLQTLPSLKLATSELGASGSMGFLQAITTHSKSCCTEEASYEDFFSSSNSKENEVQIQVSKESQNPPEVCCKDSFPSTDLHDVSFCEPHNTTKISRKTSISVNDFPVKQKITPAKHPGSIPLNISGGGKDDTEEALDADDGNRLPQHAHEKSYNSVNDSAHIAGGEDEVSECHVTDDSCKIFNERKNKHTGGLRKGGRLQKPTRTLVMTSMSSEEQNTVIQVVKKLGDFLFSNEVCETTSHVVTGSPRRTLNVMLGIARGCWIVSYEWVLWSLELGHWISEEPYELSSSFPAAPICRLQRHLSTGKYQQNLFSNQPVMFVSPTSQPPCQKLIELIQLAGGKISKALNQAKICIGKKPSKKHQEIISLSEKWILGQGSHELPAAAQATFSPSVDGRNCISRFNHSVYNMSYGKLHFSDVS